TAGFIGAVVALLTSMLLPLAGFYLVAGSVRRDLERRVWPIIAATRTSATSYLLGKWLASFAYLLVLAALALLPAVYLFFRYGSGPLAVGQLVLPWLLLAPAAMAFTAAFALLFDVTPGLRGRGGYVLWFFVFSFLFMMIPAGISGRLDQDPSNDTSTSYDPAGLVFFHDLIARSVTEPVHSISLGLIILDEPVPRVPFAPLRVDGELLLRRAATFGWTALPLLAAICMFRLTAGRGARAPRQRSWWRRAPAAATADWQAPAGASAVAFRPHHGAPSFARSVLAEGMLLWQSASWIKWPMLAASAASLVVPGSGVTAPIAIFLLLLAPVIGEAAAREELAGTGATVLAQPGLPRSRVAWKVAAVLGFVLLAAAPVLLRSLLRDGGHGLAMLLGLLFTATAAAGLGWLTGGGKLFLGAYTALWYVAIQRDSPLDFAGIGERASLLTCAAFAAVGVVSVILAAAVEKAREARG
ncbi:MAG TPA: hypothetical protein VN811_11545, partial [Thermoanaerobaculia bacterium]|nr:hypothetical protein [Thermoanaerobaculia bacterium]